jgi:hypothetical protein
MAKSGPGGYCNDRHARVEFARGRSLTKPTSVTAADFVPSLRLADAIDPPPALILVGGSGRDGLCSRGIEDQWEGFSDVQSQACRSCFDSRSAGQGVAPAA